MRRADRLFQLILLLGRRRSVTADLLASRLGVSRRTVYRDIQDLSRSGVPIEGEAGVGYRMQSGYQIPPLMFTPDEIQALVFGARLVQSCADEGACTRRRIPCSPRWTPRCRRRSNPGWTTRDSWSRTFESRRK